MKLREEMAQLLTPQNERMVYKFVYEKMKNQNEELDWSNRNFNNCYRLHCARFFENHKIKKIKTYVEADVDLNDTHVQLRREIEYSKRVYSKDHNCRKCGKFTIIIKEFIGRGLDEGKCYNYLCDSCGYSRVEN
jgi:DNA-directed RNA polymerase subunit M/transcription elongation factor TFIIS